MSNLEQRQVRALEDICRALKGIDKTMQVMAAAAESTFKILEKLAAEEDEDAVDGDDVDGDDEWLSDPDKVEKIREVTSKYDKDVLIVPITSDVDANDVCGTCGLAFCTACTPDVTPR